MWDSTSNPPGDTKVILWRTHNISKESYYISIPEFIEKNSDNLKVKYLEWIYELGEAKVKGRTLIDSLAIREGFSYWWSTALAQKFNLSGTSNIKQVINLFAFEEIVNKENIKFLKFSIPNLIA